MFAYKKTLRQFHEDILTNRIEEIVKDGFRAATGASVSPSEVLSWRNSLPHLDRVLHDPEIPDNCQVAIEYYIAGNGKERADFVLSGKNAAGEDTAIFFELKQWEKAEATQEDGDVRTRFKGGEAQTLHPSYQAWSYVRCLQDFNQTVQDEHINLLACAYLHNYEPNGALTDIFYQTYIDKAPLFLKDDALKLRQFVKNHIKSGDTSDTLGRISAGKTRPSKDLADSLAGLFAGNDEFALLGNQKIAYEAALQYVKESSSQSKKSPHCRRRPRNRQVSYCHAPPKRTH